MCPSNQVPKGKRESVGKANARIRKLVRGLHDLLDTHHARPDLQHEGITCTDGCSHARTGCCSLLTTVDIVEAEYIVDRNREAVERALPRLLEAGRKLEAAGITTPMFDAMITNPNGRDVEREASALYRRLDLPCAFLDEGNRCSIYRDRPLACRTHFVLSPPSECSEWDITAGDERYVRLDKGTRSQAPAILMRSMFELGRRTIEWGSLPQLVLAVLRRRS
jgi:Fe-S-cluster containining protein